jgi:hypothetical protein
VTRQRLIVATAVASLLGGLAVAVRTGWGYPRWWLVAVLALAVALTERASVRLVIARQRYGFALTDALVATAMVLTPGWWIGVSAAVGLVVAYWRRIARLKLAYNVGNHFLSLSVGVSCALAVGGGVAGAAVGMVVYAAINYTLVAFVVSMSSRAPMPRVLLETAGLGVVQNVGNISIGLLAGWLAVNLPLGLLGLVAPLILLWWSFEQQTQRAGEARLFGELARGQEKVLGQSIDASAQIVVTAAARLFGGAEVEMLLRHPDGPVRYTGNEHGVMTRERVESDAFGAPWVLRTLAARGVFTGMDDSRPFCSVTLGDTERPLAFLSARRSDPTARFTRTDERLAEVLAGQAASWLSVADLAARHTVAMGKVEAYGAANRVIGDIGAGTEPALTVLRESAGRLSRLAYAFDGPDPVSEIVDELHAVERAVASLLGAIALASDPGVAQGGAGTVAGAPPVPRADTEWTTTGRLETAENL